MKAIKLTVLFFFLLCKVFSQSTASKQVSTFTIDAPQLHTQKKIWVYLPKAYHNSEKKYAVIYMHDAQNLFDAETSYVGEWKVDEYLDSISENNTIIIGIEHGNEKRLEELTPYPNEKYGGGKADLYLDFIINTLKPKIDTTYKTLTDAKHTTIFGSSLGGLTSFYAVVKHPKVFGNAGVFSASFWYSNDIYTLVKNSKIDKNTRFYFAFGTEESETGVSDQQKMVDLLMEKGVKKNHIINKIIKGGKHNEASWNLYFPEAYQWLTKD
ncbi:MAG: alpha/beta hydrolase-fold protein [Gelidibacter sp.]